MRSVKAGGLCVFLAFAGNEDARALELFGKCLFGACKIEAENALLIDPKRYDVDFSVTGGDKDAENAVRAASELWQGRNRAVSGSAGMLARAKADYKRILAALYNSGYYGGAISITYAGDEVVNLPVGSELPDGAQFTVRVETGDPYTFGRAEVRNQAPPATNRRDVVPTLESLGFASGLPARADVVGKASKQVRDAWREQGYAKARVADRSVIARHPEDLLDVELDVDPGQRATYGPVTVDGTERMDPDFVRYMAKLPEGREYDPDDLDRAKKRLEKLGVFSTQKIEEAEAIDADGSLPMTLIVKERKLRRIGIGATVSSVDGVGLETFWLHRNLFGRAERLRLDAKVSGLGTTFNYQKFDYYFGAAFTKPGVFTPDTDLDFKLFAERTVNDAYTQNTGGGSLTFTHTFSDRFSGKAGAFAEYSDFTDSLGRQQFTTAGGLVSATYDARNNELDPTEGYFLRAEVKPFHEFRYGNTAVRMEAEARGYLGFGAENWTVLAARTLVGGIYGAPRDEIPNNFLFHAGGGGSVRGYGFNSIGVTEPGGGIGGGRSKVEFSAELRQRFSERFGGVLFVDAGAVSANSAPDFSQGMKIGAGAGIRYFTGLGPIRVDVGVPLRPRPGAPKFAIYAGIGQAF